jgi:RNA polymerase sigma-70 factor (ECF subfamily)
MEQKAGSAHPINERRNLGVKAGNLAKRRNSLVIRLKGGSRGAAEELVDKYYEQIYLYLRRLGHSSAVTEDLAQESFLQAWQHIGQLRNDGSLNSWLYHIASNVSKLHWRRHKGREQASIDGFDVEDERESKEKIGDFEQFERLRDAIVRLPRKHREAVVLHYMQHLTIAEAAEAAGIREGTFKSRLNRALKSLRKQIG